MTLCPLLIRCPGCNCPLLVNYVAAMLHHECGYVGPHPANPKR